MKRKLSGGAAQTNALMSPGVLLTLSILISYSVPDPFSGVMPSFTKPKTRRVLSVPGPLLRMFPATVQPLAVSPAPCTGGDEKLTTAESKTKSPWKPMKLRRGSMFVVTTGLMITVAMGTEVSMVSIGRDTVTVPAEATPLISKEAVTASVTLFQLV
jgi:hypothetical protein